MPLVVAALKLAGTLTLDSQVKTRILKSQYAALGANEHAFYRLVYEDGYAEWLPMASSTSYTIVLNGVNVTVSETKLAIPPLPPPGRASQVGRRQP